MKKTLILLLLLTIILTACATHKSDPNAITAATAALDASENPVAAVPNTSAETTVKFENTTTKITTTAAPKPSNADTTSDKPTTEKQEEKFPEDKRNWELEVYSADIEGNYKGTAKKVSVPQGVTVVEELADCVEELYLPDSVTLLRAKNSPNLKRIIVHEENLYFTAVDGVLYSKDMKEIVCYPYAKPDKIYVIPESTKRWYYIPGGKYTEEVVIHANFKITVHQTYQCPGSLKKITVSKDHSDYSSVDGVLFNKAQNWLLLYPPAKEGASYTVPQTVEALCDHAFCPIFQFKPVPRKQLKTVVLPPNLHTVADPNLDWYHDEVGTKEERIKAAFQDLIFKVQKDSAAHKELARYDLNYEFV